ncbi:MAG: hypothetical protein LBU03_03300 [Tannerellaceae bacterium]|jgi:uncharacterized iron-regulated protein|nr:hypothetical protein [Tannerellaceae bacterium]
MKKFWMKGGTLVLVAMMGSFMACDDEEPDIDSDEKAQKEVLANYVDKTVIPTYKAMAEAALKMRTANQALKTDPSDANMQAAATAWMEARIWWEKSEAWLFGPVSEDGFDIDAHIDSWPLILEEITESIEEKDGNITGVQAWEELNAEVIGFHTTEYLLFRDGKARPVSALSTAELKYLTAVTDALVWDCVLAYVAWAGEDHVAQDIKDVFHENLAVVAALTGHQAFANYGTKMKTADGYPSFAVALSDIPVGIRDIAGEVGETKILSPYENQRVEEVESWYSWHSLDDYENNIQSIKNAYLGGLDDDTRTKVSLSSFVAAKNPELDAKAKQAIEDCIAKIRAIGTGGKSFYEVVRDRINGEEVQAAAEACAEIDNVFAEIEVLIGE